MYGLPQRRRQFRLSVMQRNMPVLVPQWHPAVGSVFSGVVINFLNQWERTELRSRIPELHLRHLIGLRFAGDTELPVLVERCLRGELNTTDAVKREVREWRPDFLRA